MKKLNGYRNTHKNKWLFIKEGILSLQELALWEFYADIVDFDPKHSEYGTFKEEFNTFAVLFHCDSPNTIRNWHNKLLELGFIQKTDKLHIYKLVCHERYGTPGIWQGRAAEYEKLEKDQSIDVILQSFGTNLQTVRKKLQSTVKKSNDKIDRKVKLASKALGSSKDELSKDSQGKRIVVIKQKPRSEDEYKQIEKEGGYELLTVEDMKWIDETLIERIEVTDENEQKIVDMYFNGDWEEYRKNLILV